MLLFFIILFFAINILIGFFAAKKVHSSKDFMLAGRQLPIYICSTALFATWFGSETVMGASSQMAENGLLGIIEDPFGASLCLILVGLFFARPLYRMNLLTFGDFYKEKYGRKVELLASFCLIVSYFGWIAAQMVALGIIFNVVSGINITVGIIIGTLIVVLYTFIGGMWAISLTDFLQTIFILLGLTFALVELALQIPIEKVFQNVPENHFNFFPEKNSVSMLNYLAAWITIGLGSIPQQDVYQRVMSARSEKVAVWSSYIGGVMYFTVALIPLVLVLYAKYLQPDLFNGDEQLILPNLILQKTNIGTQILFFGALFSAIMSTASAAILAPASILSENILRKYFHADSDKQLLRLTKISVVIIAVCSFVMAMSQSNIYELVGESSALSLVSLFVPLVFGLFWKKATSTGALLSIIFGMTVWMLALFFEMEIHPLLYGLGASFLGMMIGTRMKSNTM